MSKTLTITWDNPIPHPSCGYRAFYRRNTDPQYSELDSSGSTSGTTFVTTTVTAPACFEGYVTSDCCDDNISIQQPFGVNSYLPFNVDVVNDTGIGQFVLTVSSEYANSYDLLVAGSFMSSIFGNIAYSVTYPSGSTSSDFIIAAAQPLAVVSNIVVDSYAPVFDQGGELQQFDSISTPPYFQFFWDGTSGVTWYGSPAGLPSFILTAFNPTEVDGVGDTIQGNLLISWIYDSQYMAGVFPYDTITFEVYDQGTNVLGSTTINTGTLGLRNTIIVMNRASPSYPLDAGVQFTMKVAWSDESGVDTKEFFLPLP